jgi:hypothetical protein
MRLPALAQTSALAVPAGATRMIAPGSAVNANEAMAARAARARNDRDDDLNIVVLDVSWVE